MDSKQIVLEWMGKIFQTNINDEGRNYISNAWPRYIFLLNQIENYAQQITANQDGSGLSLLDVGPHFLTTLLRKKFPKAVINTLGYEVNWISPSPNVQQHCTFDLNNSQFTDQWPKFQQHDIVVMSEVIEHLYTAPWLVLKFIKTLIKSNGFLILSTPNAAAAMNRIFLAFGRNPFEMIRESRDNPGHFREYTKSELISIGIKSGLNVAQISLENYFHSSKRWINNLYRITSFLPEFRNGITIIYQNA